MEKEELQRMKNNPFQENKNRKILGYGDSQNLEKRDVIIEILLGKARHKNAFTRTKKIVYFGEKRDLILGGKRR